MKKKKFEFFDIIIFAIIAFIWGYFGYIFFPGIMTNDSIDQWNQVQAGIFGDIHAPTHTIIEFGLSKIWNSPMVVCVFQILVFGIIWTYICKVLRNQNRIVGILQVIGTIFISLMPINYMYAITLWKDILYSYIILLYSILLYVGVKNKFKYSIVQNILIGICLVLIMKLRHNGIIITIISLPLLLGFIWNYTKSKLNLVKLITPFIVFLVLVNLILSCFDITKSATAMNKKWLSLYKLGVLYQNGAINDQKDLDLLNDIMPLELWDKYTWDYTQNGLVFSENMDYKKVNLHSQELWDMMIKYMFRNPKIMIKHYIKLNSIVWEIDEPKKGYTSSIQTWTYIRDGELAHKEERGYLEKSKKIDKLVEDYKILFRPAIYMYGSIIIIVLIVVITKKKSYLIVLIPMLGNALSIIPANTGQDVRYLYCNFLVFYLVVFSVFDIIRQICLSRIENNTKESKRVNKVENDDAEEKVLIIIPAYNEEAAIRKTIMEIENNDFNCDIVVINDCSQDNTVNEVMKTNAKLINLPNNLGIGGAVQTGYKYAKQNNYDIAIQLDGDGQHKACYIKDLVEEIRNGYDMVIGSRFVGKRTYKQTKLRMLGINITSEIIEFFTNNKINDTTSGYRAINKEVINEFANNYPYDYPEPITTMRMIIKGKKVKEVEVEMRNRTTGKSSISPIKSIIYMIKVTLSLFLQGIKNDK